MDNVFNYSMLFEQALGKIKSVRDPHATRPDTIDLKWDCVEKNVVFNFINNDLRKQYNVSSVANDISLSCLCFMIVQLMEKYKCSVQILDIPEAKGLAVAKLYVHDKKNNTLLLFKEIEKCAFWKTSDMEPKEVQSIIDSCGAKSCKYIYFVFDYAYLQIIGHNDNKDDPGRGYNVYSIQWFFKEYFGIDEYDRFLSAYKKYITDVKNCIGYSTLKNLTPGSMINFRKILENEIVHYPYQVMLNKQVGNYNLITSELNKIKEQYFKKNIFLCLLGCRDFAESFVTAEWLYDSMKTAQAIDLTIIGMGYFKASEQLLFEIICLHKNKGLYIKSDYSRHDLPPMIELNDENINNRAIDTTIGSMAVFVRNNLNLFRNDLTWHTRKYIRETIFEYKEIRNNYFHKENIHDWEKIKSIRNITFELLFLLLGSISISDNTITALGLENKAPSDYYKLCEYVHYHHDDIFYLDFGNEHETIVFGNADIYSKVVNNGFVEYTGVYFRELGRNGRTRLFRKDELPQKIFLGKFVFGYDSRITITPIKVKTIFEYGKFIGPSLADENELIY